MSPSEASVYSRSLENSQSLAQAPAQPGTDWDKAARDSHKENSEELAKFEILMSIEPAFQFKA